MSATALPQTVFAIAPASADGCRHGMGHAAADPAAVQQPRRVHPRSHQHRLGPAADIARAALSQGHRRPGRRHLLHRRLQVRGAEQAAAPRGRSALACPDHMQLGREFGLHGVRADADAVQLCGAGSAGPTVAEPPIGDIRILAAPTIGQPGACSLRGRFEGFKIAGTARAERPTDVRSERCFSVGPCKIFLTATPPATDVSCA